MRAEIVTRRSLMRRLLTPKDAGALLGLSTGRIQQLDREGRLRAIRDSAGRRLFREGDVLRFKAERERYSKDRNNGAGAGGDAGR
jgi:excisionase family DNA binding protein